jgi:hypothetical protein
MARTAKTRIGAGLGIVASVLILGACSKPTPNVTAQSGSTSVIVKPSVYCFSPTDCKRQGFNFPSLTIGPNENVLVDVPRKLVDKGWAINLLDVDGKTSLGNTGAITDSHSYRLPASINSGKPFIAEVLQLNGNRSDGSRWSFFVKVDPTKS